jgi:hypothetical protein
LLAWPREHQALTLPDVRADAQGTLISYQASRSNGPGFVNVEHFPFTGDSIAHIDVYFGENSNEQQAPGNRPLVQDKPRPSGPTSVRTLQ